MSQRSRASRVRQLCRRLVQVFYRPYVLARIAKPSEARLFGRRLLTDPQVFHPVYFLSTRILIDELGTLELEGRQFLDMGTGTGSLAIFAAGRGARVTACDVNPRALTLAEEDARRNGVPVEVVKSDLFAALPGRRFDVISFNVPFYPRDPQTPFEAAFFAGRDFETVRRFAAGCADHLAPDGLVVVIFSEDSGRERMGAIFAEAALEVVGERTTQRYFERFHLLRLRPAPRREPTP